MLALLEMTGPRAPIPADPAEHPLRAALTRGDRLLARSRQALRHLLDVDDQALLGEAVVAHVRGLLCDLARQIAEAHGKESLRSPLKRAVSEKLLGLGSLCQHLHALAIEWRLALSIEAERAVDPVLSPFFERSTGADDATFAALAVAGLAAQARFAQAQRRMHLPLGELPAELFHATLVAVRGAITEDYERGEAKLRADYDESGSRLALLARLVASTSVAPTSTPAIEEAGVALWLSSVASTTGEDRDRVALAAADPHSARLLLTLRAAGVSPADAERQLLILHPDIDLPTGLRDVGTREAAQWLREAGQ